MAKWVRVACYTCMRTLVRIPGTYVKTVSIIRAGGVEMGESWSLLSASQLQVSTPVSREEDRE